MIERDDLQLPLQIRPVHNDAVQVWRNKTDGKLVYRFYGKVVPLQDVIHARYQTFPGEIIGLNPIQLLALTFGNAIAKERFVESYFLNSANPMGVIQVPGYLDRVETRKMLRGWVAAHQGLNKANLPAILTEGAEFKALTISPTDSQLIEALQFSEVQICGRIFRVPPHMVGILERVQGLRGIEQLERSFFANTLVGYLQVGMETLTACHRQGQYVHFDTTKRERGATLERAQAGALGMNSGVFVADEIRDWFDLPALPDGQGQYSFTPINTTLLQLALRTLNDPNALPPALNGKTDSGAQPNGSAPPQISGKPIRKGAPSISPKRSEGNGHEMTVDQAWHIVQTAVDQSRRMQYAADLSAQLGSPDEEE